MRTAGKVGKASSRIKLMHAHEKVGGSCVSCDVTRISSTLEVMGVPVTTQAWRRQSADTMMAATLDDCATSCASSSTTRQNPNCSSRDLPHSTTASEESCARCHNRLTSH